MAEKVAVAPAMVAAEMKVIPEAEPELSGYVAIGLAVIGSLGYAPRPVASLSEGYNWW